MARTTKQQMENIAAPILNYLNTHPTRTNTKRQGTYVWDSNYGIIFVDAHGGKYNVINARGTNEEAWYRLAAVRDFLNDAVLT